VIKKHTILVVDDEELFIEYIQRILSDENYNVISASSGQEGIALLEKQQVSMVISEYKIPLMNGLEFLEKVRIIYPDILTIMVTDHADIELVIKAVNEAGVYKFLLKSWDDIDFKNTIKKTLESLQVIKERDVLIRKVKTHEATLKELEKRYPGITKVEKDEDGYILPYD
jgi:response regulator RpfG family c-di-GMP phosphodiesterase